MGKILYCISISLCTLLLLSCTGTKSAVSIHSNEFYQPNEVVPSSSPVWSKLTPYESWVISGDHITLKKQLALSLLLTDAIRTEKEYLQIEQKVKQFIKAVTPKIDDTDVHQKKGKILFSEMQSFFYPSVQKNRSQYILDHSSLKELITQGHYGTNSSALLFTLLADYFDLNPEVVVMPTHNYIQISSNPDSIITIEPTAPNGYNVLHNAQYYSDVDSVWFSKRGLLAASADDVSQKKIMNVVDLIRVGAESRYQERGRLFEKDMALLEMRTYFNPTDPNYTEQLLVHYQDTMNVLLERKDSMQLQQFFLTVDPILDAMKKLEKPSDLFYTTYCALQFKEVDLLFTQKKYREVLNKLHALKEFVPHYNDNTQYVNYNFHLFYNTILTRLSEERNYTEAIYLQDTHSTVCEWIDECKVNLGWVYTIAIENLWEKEAWSDVLKLYDSFGQQTYQSPIKESLGINKEIAYMNLVVSHENSGEIELARKALQRCQFDLPDAVECRNRLKSIQ